MRVVLEALGIQDPGGTRSATLSLLEGLARAQCPDQLVVLLSKPESLVGVPAGIHQIVVPGSGRALDRVRLQFMLPTLLRRLGADVVHHVKGLSTFGVKCRQVVTIHDLTILRYPSLFPKLEVGYWWTVGRAAALRADLVITDSQATARDVRRFYGVSEGKIKVVYCSIGSQFSPEPGAREADIRKSYGLVGEYLLHVGSISRKKNLPTLLRAMKKLASDGTFAGQLALVGREYHKGRESGLSGMVNSLGLSDKVVFTGTVAQDHLPVLYRGAKAFVFPSVHEGFGLVPIEAMACGVPVVASACEAVAEVASKAAFLVQEAYDYDSFAQGIAEALDHRKRAAMISAGLERARQFSQSVQAEATWRLYRDLGSTSLG